MEKINIVIVGGGFAGVNFAKQLSKDQDFNITLVDKNNYHFFPPLLYQVATAFIETTNITYPFRKMFQKKRNIRFHNGTFLTIQAKDNFIETDTGVLKYDHLVLALGTQTNFFGNENIKNYAFSMKSIDDAVNLRNKMLLNLERISRLTDQSQRMKLSNIVIAGGGPTGVELAGMLAEMGSKIKDKDYPELKEFGKIYLVNSSDSLLRVMSQQSQREALQILGKLGVVIKLNTSVKDFDNEIVTLSSGEQIDSPILIWASGVSLPEIKGLPEQSVGAGKRILVDPYNLVLDTDNIYALGDMCLLASDASYPHGHPQLAQVAIQQGKLLAKNMILMYAGKKMIPFRYVNKGSMAIISKYKAVVDLPSGYFSGFFAWLTWLFVHLIPIAGFRNKAKISFNWFFSMITIDPSLRVIIRPESPNHHKGKE
ncbi:NAD(P)/FAD-dependent oxidoreductase [Flavobacterium sp. CSZ]|nr:NAD(P)/FAD-dependent oxidoreductase [Flavobacterium sp. CSZ]